MTEFWGKITGFRGDPFSLYVGDIKNDSTCMGNVLEWEKHHKAHGYGVWYRGVVTADQGYKVLKYFEGRFQNGARHGEGKYFYPNGEIRVSGTWQYDMLDGEDIVEYYDTCSNDGTRSIKWRGVYYYGIRVS